MKKIVVLVSIGWFIVAGASQAQTKKVADFGDKAFSSADVVRALSGTRTRGLSMNKEGASEAAPDEGGRKLSVRLQFGLGSANLTAEAKERLDAVGQALTTADLAGMKLIVSGHTDSTGNYESNLRLSKRRADAVKLYLVSAHDVAPERLKSVGRGPDEPIEGNPASPLNRRVQFAVMD